MSYKLIIGKIESLSPIEGADRIKKAIVYGNEVVVGLDYKLDQIVCFAPVDGIFEDEFCVKNDLYPIFDDNGKKIGGGFFDRNKPRIRAQKFKSVKSSGFAFPLSFLEYTGYDLTKLKVGEQFDELNGRKICSKYVSLSTQRAGARNKTKKNKILTHCFPEHVETEQFKFNANLIKKGDLITISSKTHGTSARFSYTYTESQNPIVNFLAKYLPIKTKNLEYLVGTRRVILEKEGKSTYYGNEEFRYKHLNLVKTRLNPGEIIYGELVGYTTDGKKIMDDHETKETKDKEFIKKYGNTISYTYGCMPGECEFYVYRIQKIDENGNAIDLTWPQVKKRCVELGLKYVVEIESFIYDGNIRDLQELVNKHTDGPDLIDSNIHREGVVIRVDNENTTPLFLKNKSFYFGLMEGYIKSNDNYVDMEESS
jgi:hypothetical protein